MVELGSDAEEYILRIFEQNKAINAVPARVDTATWALKVLRKRLFVQLHFVFRKPDRRPEPVNPIRSHLVSTNLTQSYLLKPVSDQTGSSALWAYLSSASRTCCGKSAK